MNELKRFAAFLSSLAPHYALIPQIQMLVTVFIRLIMHTLFFVLFAAFLTLGSLCTKGTVWALETVSRHSMSPTVLSMISWLEVLALLALAMYLLICHVFVLLSQLMREARPHKSEPQDSVESTGDGAYHH